ncbi:DEAD/DEAH box helicase [Pseudoalteromonas denitrificans]|uniref:Protein translocase subunit SecA n=1 Tax=Pseudoalteromonas denitrificans DSM 6059 TaxID=1123010 RepID=A0A1I1NH87_9GAMM|nr:DEAD/DEAH box helicase [Pseudoalteromonas denitrificans]SFC96632.1 preprotein translocase subunit SecA [Pseudoalteromonas denitrificans DSM 6059]
MPFMIPKLNKIKLKYNLLKRKLSHHHSEYDLSIYMKKVNLINETQCNLQVEPDFEIKNKIRKIKLSIEKGALADSFLIELFALIKEVIKRKCNIKIYDEQLIGAIAMHEGKISQMQTGEGKTLASIFTICLNAFTGNSVHVFTVNEYLAKRDVENLKQLYSYFELSVAYVSQNMDINQKKFSYQCDVTYVSAVQCGFDYLKDTVSIHSNETILRPLSFVLIDEIDSVLIDMARDPLILAKNKLADVVGHDLSDIVKQLKKDLHFKYSETRSEINLTLQGEIYLEKILRVNNLYDQKNNYLLNDIYNAIKAEYLLKINVDYLVKKNEIKLIDKFSGRIIKNQRWPDGLQSAVEIKEGIKLNNQGKILNSITIQNFIFNYKKISGMTATAEQSLLEFHTIYHLITVIIPPHKTSNRIDLSDRIFKSNENRDNALLCEIIKQHKTGRPVLIGTSSVAHSILLAKDLKKRGYKNKILNANDDELESKIISNAALMGAITITTNMAGRGTDIKLPVDKIKSEKVKALGGLLVLGCERHEADRIDFQLKGRAGRQGEPGETQFFISLEQAMLKKYTEKFNFLNCFHENEITEPKLLIKVEKVISRIQKIEQAKFLDIKLQLNKFNQIIEQQRVMFFQQKSDFLALCKEVEISKKNIPNALSHLTNEIELTQLHNLYRIEKLTLFNETWSQYLINVSEKLQTIHFQVLAGIEPLQDFKKWTATTFSHLINNFESQLNEKLKTATIKSAHMKLSQSNFSHDESAWTYQTKDQLFDELLDNMLVNSGASVANAINGGFFMLMYLSIRNIIRNKNINL